MSGGDRSFRVEAAVVFTLSAALLTCAWRKWLPLDLTEAFWFATGAICVQMVPVLMN